MKKLLKDKKFNKFMSVLLTTAMIAMTFSIDSISARADEKQPEEQQQTGQMDQEGLMGGIEEGSEEELLLEGESSPEEELLPEDELMPEEEIMPEEEPMEEETSENEGEPEGDSEEEEGIFEDSGDELDAPEMSMMSMMSIDLLIPTPPAYEISWDLESISIDVRDDANVGFSYIPNKLPREADIEVSFVNESITVNKHKDYVDIKVTNYFEGETEIKIAIINRANDELASDILKVTANPTDATFLLLDGEDGNPLANDVGKFGWDFSIGGGEPNFHFREDLGGTLVEDKLVETPSFIETFKYVDEEGYLCKPIIDWYGIFGSTSRENKQGLGWEIHGVISGWNRTDTKTNLTITPDLQSVSYNGTMQSFTGGMTMNIILPEGYTVSGMELAASGTDAGQYPIGFTGTPMIFNGDGVDVTSEFRIILTPTMFTINPAEVIITVDNKSKFEGTLDPEFTGTVLDVFNNPFDLVVGLGYAREIDDTTKEAVGDDIDIVAAYEKSDNYSVTVITGKLEILARTSISLMASSQTVSYNGTEQSYTGTTYEGLPDGYTVEGLTSEASGTMADTYKIVTTGEPIIRDGEGNDVTEQFYIEIESGEFIIAKAKVTITVDPKSKTVGEADPVFTGIVTVENEEDFTEPDFLTDFGEVTYLRAEGDELKEAVGDDITITAIYGQRNYRTMQEYDNYDVTLIEAKLTINPVPVIPPGPTGPTGPTAPTTPTEPTLVTILEGPTPLEATPIPFVIIPDEGVPAAPAPVVEEPVIIPEEEVPLADEPGPPEEPVIPEEPTIEPEDTTILEEEEVPLAVLEDNCIIHWIILLVTLLYCAYAIPRAYHKNRKIREMEPETDDAII